MLDKLTIRGIRNFGVNDEDEQEITFSSPFTFINGDNGTGKTTIIECIRLALTGTYPPKCKAIDFIHRPDVSNINESRAEISLIINTGNNSQRKIRWKHSVSYSEEKGLKVDGSATSVVTRIFNGQEQAISRTKDQSIKGICEHLNVSPALIKYVLFCHQEDAYWLLNTDKPVEDRFNEIFDTKKYDNALDTQYKISDQFVKQIVEKQNNLEIMEQLKEETNKKRSELSKNQNELSQMQENYNRFNAELTPFSKKIDDLKNVENQIAYLSQEIKIAETDLMNKRGNEKNLLSKIQDIFDGTKEELVKKIEQHNDNNSNKQDQLQEIGKKMTDAHLEFNRIEQEKNSQDILYQKLMRDHDLETYILNEIEWYKDTLKIDFNIVINDAIDTQSMIIQNERERLQNCIVNVSNENEMNDAKHEKLIREHTEKKIRIEIDIATIINEQKISELELNTKKVKLQTLQQNSEKLNEISEKIEKYKVKLDILESEIKESHEEKVKLAKELMNVDESFFSKATNAETTNQLDIKKRDDLNSLESLYKHRKTLTEQIKNLDISIEANNKEYRKIMWCMFEHQNEILQLHYTKHEHNSVQACVIELDDKIRQMNDEKEIKEQSLNSIELNIQLAERLRSKTKITGTEKRDKAIKHLFKLELIIKFFDRVWKQKPSSQDLVIDMNECKMKLDDLKNQKLIQNDTIRMSDEQIRTLNGELSDQNAHYRDLNDNLELKNVQCEINNIENRLNSLQQQTKSSDVDRITGEIESLYRKMDTLKTNRDETFGQMTEKNNTIAKLHEELENPDYRDSEHNCEVAKYELIVHEKATNDLKLACEKMGKAISQYHMDKIKKINRIIREYWTNIYKGNDIEYIEMQTAETKTLSHRREYTYRVVALKNGKILDFRGQCSAGQRVLACLIIRLALADTFAAHLGTIALDEPTTNLDKANIDSLCEALNRIADERQAQNNFNLLIITHDKDFITRMGRGSLCWRTERDEITGKSRIRDANDNDNDEEIAT